MWTGHPDDAAPETVEILDGIVVRRLPMPLPATNWSALRRSAVTGTRTLFSLRSAVAPFVPTSSTSSASAPTAPTPQRCPA